MNVEIWDNENKKYRIFNDVVHIYNGCTRIVLRFKSGERKELKTEYYSLDFIYE